VTLVHPSRDRQGAISNRGITLIEMVVVLAIVGLIAGISYPAISAGLESVRMISATDGVATFLNGAVNRAERKQQAIELVIEPKEGVLLLYSNEPGFKKQYHLPDGVVIEAVHPVDGSGDPQDQRRFLFLPGATVPGIGIQLRNNHDAHRIVHLDPMTGFPRVESVNPQVAQ
jgi:prepilin-type N-terminal cleavage/methylation domain-containing protein